MKKYHAFLCEHRPPHNKRLRRRTTYCPSMESITIIGRFVQNLIFLNFKKKFFKERMERKKDEEKKEKEETKKLNRALHFAVMKICEQEGRFFSSGNYLKNRTEKIRRKRNRKTVRIQTFQRNHIRIVKSHTVIYRSICKGFVLICFSCETKYDITCRRVSRGS